MLLSLLNNGSKAMDMIYAFGFAKYNNTWPVQNIPKFKDRANWSRATF